LKFAQPVQSQSQCLLAGFAALGRENEPSFQDARFGFSSGEIRSIVDVESGMNRLLDPPSRQKPCRQSRFSGPGACHTCAELAACAYLATAGPTAGEVINQGLQGDRIRYDVPGKWHADPAISLNVPVAARSTVERRRQTCRGCALKICGGPCRLIRRAGTESAYSLRDCPQQLPCASAVNANL
jgi:hypothetical protein